MTSNPVPPITIVLADDHGIVRAGLKALLDAQPDMRIVGEAEDAQRAVELVLEYQPAVLVTEATVLAV